MGRSAACFKFIACGENDTKDADEAGAPEVQSNGCGWSFRKRSSQHRVLNNSAVSESPVQNEEIAECIDADDKATTNFDATEKVLPILNVVEKPQLSAPFEVKVPESVLDTKTVSIEEEASIVIIQAAIRAYMAQKEHLKLRKVIKMQAVVRGHLVRRHAVGTLRCVLAIVKVQTMVRARYASRLLEGSTSEKDAYIVHAEDNVSSKAKVKKDVKNQANARYISIEKLISNKFAQQLLESTPKTKPIHIKCEPSKTNSAWQWVERWMLASSPRQSPSVEASAKGQSNEENEEIVPNPVTDLTPKVLCQPTSSHEDLISEVLCPPTSSHEDLTPEVLYQLTSSHEDLTPEVLCRPTSGHGYINIVTPDTGSDILASAVKVLKIDETPAVNESIELSEAENQITSNGATDLDCCSTVKINEIVEISNMDPDSFNVSVMSEGEIEQPRNCGKRVSTDQLETEPKKPSFASRRISNPDFTAIQSKFEELSSAAVFSVSNSSSYQENEVNSKVLKVPGEEVDRIASEMVEICEKDNSISDNFLPLIGGSECGTELSISSTLDSPDRDRDVEKGDQMRDTVVKFSDTNGAEYCEVEVNKDLPEESVDSINNLGGALIVAESLQQEQEREEPTCDLNSTDPAEVTPPLHLPSPEASPRSHMTIPESQGTPASQASVNTKANRAEKSVLSHKRKSLSAGKKSPSNPKQESASSNSKEFPKDRKITIRRGLKREDAEQEPRDSNSNSTGSIPHFMQATESALAKLNANNSPRSSPDVRDREVSNKNRHSLPGANGRQGSPRIQRSMSQAQRGGKANGTKHQRGNGSGEESTYQKIMHFAEPLL